MGRGLKQKEDLALIQELADVVEGEVEGIGVLSNPVIAEPETTTAAA